jgi:hypothetical protein
MSLGALQNYNNWHAENCFLKRNYFVCEIPESLPEIDQMGTYAYQCQCRAGYNGYNCQIAPDPQVPG